MEKILLNYVCPSLELIEEEIEWEEIDTIKDFEMFYKNLDNLYDDEQIEYLSDIIYNSLFEYK